jgi:hypothetical protein
MRIAQQRRRAVALGLATRRVNTNTTNATLRARHGVLQICIHFLAGGSKTLELATSSTVQEVKTRLSHMVPVEDMNIGLPVGMQLL